MPASNWDISVQQVFHGFPVAAALRFNRFGVIVMGLSSTVPGRRYSFSSIDTCSENHKLFSILGCTRGYGRETGWTFPVIGL